MPKIGELQAVNLRDLIRNNSNAGAQRNESINPKDFGETVSDFIDAVNQKAVDSSKKVTDVIEGRSENLHEAMASLEESGLSFKLMLEIRNKLLESYQEIQRMQI